VDEASLHDTKVVDLLIIGGGPATLGFIINALKTNRFPELIQNDGIAILDTGTSFGGGNLCNYGINSNTSANGFVKSIFVKEKKVNTSKQKNLVSDKKAMPLIDVDEPNNQLLSPKWRTPLSPKIMNP